MELFFVRHGQTDYNAVHRHQSSDEPLNAIGRKQAEELITEIKKLQPTHIVSSDMVRARQTAEIILKAFTVPFATEASLGELYRPDYLLGKKHVSFATLFFLWSWFTKRDSLYWQAYGGESQKDFFTRLQAAQYYLASFPDDARVIVISHSFFITVFLHQLCMKQLPNFFQTVRLLFRVRRLSNSSWSQVTYTPREHACSWTVRSFDNDAYVIE